MRRLVIFMLVAATLIAVPAEAAVAPTRTPSLARRPPFSFTVAPLDAATRNLMNGSSWRPGCPVPMNQLRIIHMRFWGFDRHVHRGEMVVRARYTQSVVRVFRRLYTVRYPIRRMRLVDRYGANDHASMAADNTSAFNCRWRSGLCCTWSQHAYGRAIDINPVENPFVFRSGFSPPAGRPYLDRSQHRRGMVHIHDPVWWAFHAVRWGWGGTWSTEHDYQHFSSNGL
jgi:D-alanyl-D-alanine carboxypeptidase